MSFRRVAPLLLLLVACGKKDTPVAEDAAPIAPSAKALASASSTAEPVASAPVPVESASAAPTATATATAIAIPTGTATVKIDPKTPAPQGDPIKLVDRGAEPRKKIRYKFTVGQIETVKTTITTSGTVEMGGAAATPREGPAIDLTMTVDPKSIAADGSLRYEAKLVGIEAKGSDVAQKEFAPLKGMSGWVIMSPRGIAKESEMTVPPGIGLVGSQMIEQIKQIARDVAVPFPEEEIGKGAKWEKVTKVDSAQAKTLQTETYTLTDWSGDSGKVAVTIVETAPAQPMGGFPPEVHAQLESVSSQGSGIEAFDLSRIVRQAQITANQTTTFSTELPSGDRQRTRTVMKIGIAIAGSK